MLQPKVAPALTPTAPSKTMPFSIKTSVTPLVNMSPLKNLILFFSKDKNQIEKFPLSDFFSRLQSTLGDISFYFFLFSFIRVVIRFKFVTNITQAPCIFVS